MKHPILSLVLCLFLVGCAKNSSNVSPTNAGPTTPVTPVTPPNSDPYGEQIRASVPIDLTDKTNYSGLIDITSSAGTPGNVYLPLVGDARVRLQTSASRTQSINGKLFLAFEDQRGFWAAQWDNAFPGTGIQNTVGTNQFIDIIFADDDLVVRAVGSVSNNNLYGTLYYRVRQNGDTACRQQNLTCTINWNGSIFPVPCPPSYTVDLVTPCRNYMNPSNAQVKSLGNFTNEYSKISTLPGAN